MSNQQSDLKHVTIDRQASTPARLVLKINQGTPPGFGTCFFNVMHTRPELTTLRPVINYDCGMLTIDMRPGFLRAFDDVVGSAHFQLKHYDEIKIAIEAHEFLQTDTAVTQMCDSEDVW